MIWSKADAQQTADRLRSRTPSVLAAQARFRGDPVRGSLVFHTSAAGCIKCHSDGSIPSPLGPTLTNIPPHVTDEYIVEAILYPSRAIRKGFETTAIVTNDGIVKTGLIESQNDKQLVLRELSDLLHPIIIPREDIEDISTTTVSMMPEGLVESLRSESDFFDLVKYISEVVHGGATRATELRPSDEELIVKDDSQGLDHAGILRDLGDRDLRAGRRIFQSHCKNCHGVDGNTPNLPLARAFGQEPLKNGADPYSMFMTLTQGSGLMASVQYLSPKERYQVVHYIRESLMKTKNPSYKEMDEAYFEGLPAGTNLGEVDDDGPRDFGPVLGSQIGKDINNALSIRLNEDVTAGYDLHRMKMAGVWRNGFLDLSETHHYRQRGEQMPQIDGDLMPGLDGWQWSNAQSFNLPENAKPERGPLKKEMLDFKGYSLFGEEVILRYAIEGRDVLESIASHSVDIGDSIDHTLQIGAGEKPLRLSVAAFSKIDDQSGVFSLSDLRKQTDRANADGNVAVITAVPENPPRYIVDEEAARELDLGTPDRTIAVRFRTDGTGTLVSSAPRNGQWKPDGKTLFLRGDEVVFDIGWVGAIGEEANVRDGRWHTAALVVDTDVTSLYVDNELLGKREGFRRPPVEGNVLKIGATSTNFGGDFTGSIDWVRVYDGAVAEDELEDVLSDDSDVAPPLLFEWTPEITEVVSSDAASESQRVVASVVGDVEDLMWDVGDDGRIVLEIPAATTIRTLRISLISESSSIVQLMQAAQSRLAEPVEDLSSKLHGGPRRWPETISVTGKRGVAINGYALDTIPVPFENPWNAWLRTSAVDFFPDGRAVVTTHGGDVYIVSGIDEHLEHVVWQRYAAGLFEPFGVRVVDELIYVTCHGGSKRVHDKNGDGEADFIEAFWNDDDVSSVFHAYNFNLQTDEKGNFYLAKAGQHTDHHRPGSIMKIPPEGGKADVVAWGVRTPNGMGRLKDGRFTVSDNQGPWMPAGKISAFESGDFLGNMPIRPDQDQWLRERHGGKLPTTFEQPFIWMPQELDNSCGGQLWIEDSRFGPLSGHLLHSSFGKGWLYYLSLQNVDGQTQASIIALPHQWDAGVMRLRINPADGQVYGVGLSGWQGPSGGKDGCFQRLRYANAPCRLIERIDVVDLGLQIRFNFDLDPDSVDTPDAWNISMWNYLWSKKYGSDQFSVLDPEKKGRDRLEVKDVQLINARTVVLSIPELQVCDQVHVGMLLADQSGELFPEEVYLTIHAIPGHTYKTKQHMVRQE
ncbi:MAG: DUF6797 domain-containing protein [Pirellulales bacterium]